MDIRKKKNKKSITLNIAYLFEKVLAFVVLITVFLGTIDILRLIWDTYIVNFDQLVEYNQLNSMLAQILLLVIGVELVVMLSLHIPGALIEVLLYAIARKMILIPKSEGMEQVLIGVIAIAGLFLIKKYFTTPVATGGKKKSKKSQALQTSIHDEKETRKLEAMNEDHSVDLFCGISPKLCAIKNKVIKDERCEVCEFRRRYERIKKDMKRKKELEKAQKNKNAEESAKEEQINNEIEERINNRINTENASVEKE